MNYLINVIHSEVGVNLRRAKGIEFETDNINKMSVYIFDGHLEL